MASAKEWVLYGDDQDLTLGMRNALAADAGRATGGGGAAAARWAPAHAFCELFLIQVRQSPAWPLAFRAAAESLLPVLREG